MKTSYLFAFLLAVTITAANADAIDGGTIDKRFLTDTFKDLKKLAENAVKKAEEAAKKVAHEVEDVAKKVAKEAKDVATKVSHEAKDAAKKVAKTAQNVAKKVLSSADIQKLVGKATNLIDSAYTVLGCDKIIEAVVDSVKNDKESADKENPHEFDGICKTVLGVLKTLAKKGVKYLEEHSSGGN